jgi:hypothetical protein
VLSFLRRNAIALLALFVALGGTAAAAVVVSSNSQVAPDTISGHKPPSGDQSNIISASVGSADLANGSVTNDKLQKSSVTNGKIASNAVTGAKVDESTLGRVPDSAKLGGVDAIAFRPGSAMAEQETDQCAVTGTYELCAPVALTVPDGDYYIVDVHTSMSAYGTAGGYAFFCAAYEGPTCVGGGNPLTLTMTNGQYTAVADNGTGLFGPGTHHFGMAANFSVPIFSTNSANTKTVIRWFDLRAQGAGGAAKVAAPASRAEQPHPLR